MDWPETSRQDPTKAKWALRASTPVTFERGTITHILLLPLPCAGTDSEAYLDALGRCISLYLSIRASALTSQDDDLLRRG